MFSKSVHILFYDNSHVKLQSLLIVYNFEQQLPLSPLNLPCSEALYIPLTVFQSRIPYSRNKEFFPCSAFSLESIIILLYFLSDQMNLLPLLFQSSILYAKTFFRDSFFAFLHFLLSLEFNLYGNSSEEGRKGFLFLVSILF